MSVPLTSEQEAFLEECNLEFSDRFTNADLEYKRIYDLAVPSPPIMCPWFAKTRFNKDRGDNRYNDRGDHRYNDRGNRSYNDRGDRSYNGRSDNYGHDNYNRQRNSYSRDVRSRPY